MAFLKLSVCVAGEGDELPVHDDDEDDEGENSMEMTKCLMPPSLEQEKRYRAVISCFMIQMAAISLHFTSDAGKSPSSKLSVCPIQRD